MGSACPSSRDDRGRVCSFGVRLSEVRSAGCAPGRSLGRQYRRCRRVTLAPGPSGAGRFSSAQSVFRNGRSAEPCARAGQMDSATVTLLRMEAIGIEGLSRATQAQRARARSMERRQERASPVANLESPGTVDGDAHEFLRRLGLATIGCGQGLKRMHSTQRTAVYVTRMRGGVGGRDHAVPSCPD
jgi:hypothetical protein